ncbi:selenide, water dikinase SelD [Solirhodobacter olei]|uniref:selenide, water dikinase SelD n=1 Tax=Solirhodobacter olei TaxID=2493082 RepID=UPI000FDB2209|nr:selenide, water dikinase SelD [Solirhodobacter olei]
MQPQIPLTRDLVLIGGGHAHALVLLRWGMKPLPGTRLTVIDPNPTAPYTGMLPGLIAGHYAPEELQIDLVRLARHAGARLILGRATGIDRAARRIAVPGRPDVRYDLASIDIGITSDLPSLPGAAEHAVAAKPLGAYAVRWDAFVAAPPDPAPVVILGAGLAGAELALATAHRLRRAGIERPEVSLVEQAATPLAGVGAATRRALLRHMARQGVELITGTTAAEVTEGAVRLSDGRVLPSAFTLTATGARPHPWLAQTGLELTDGFITVGPTLRSTTDPAIFAAGDCAHLAHAPRPKAGVFAVREAPVLFRNLRAALTGARPRRYHPQRDYLKLVSTGGRGAVADKWGRALDGWLLWRWKDRIDRRFMRMFRHLPQMPPPHLPHPLTLGVAEELSGSKPLCGGCGAKIGPGALAAALSGLPGPQRADVLSGPGDDAAVIELGSTREVITTDHLRAFCEDPYLMARIAATHALGDIWAMGAAPRAALVQVTVPRASERLQADMMAELMAAASAVFRAAGADIVGGHSSIGAELTIGFTVTGLAERPISKAGAQPGDALILTKPLGTGTVLAAEMARAAPGDAVAAAWASMIRPLGPAAAILAPEAHAMTDVTGFGLAGHLLEILEASGAAVEIDLDAVPCLPGAEALAAAGEASTLAPANLAAVAPQLSVPEGPKAALLVDPQTGGGLLAAVPGAAAEGLLTQLRAAGEEAAIIGRVVAGTPHIAAA